METKTTINLDERKMNILLSWIYIDICKPTDWHEVDKVLVRQLKNACKRLGCEDLFKEITNDDAEYDEMGLEISKEELKQRKDDIRNTNGKFFCAKCNLRTDEKTPQTMCVICGGDLRREIVEGRDFKLK